MQDDPNFNVREIFDGSTIRYKSPPPGTCMTRSSDQKQYTGYVQLKPGTLGYDIQNYTINTFFWFVEAQANPKSAPLTVYLSGGPGSSSMGGLFQEIGPCEAIEIAKDRIGTRAREWSWDRSSNMLFIDQPVQTGLSFDALHNGSLDLLTGTVGPPSDPPPGQSSETFLRGVFSSNDGANTANTTATAAGTVWHTLQAFTAAFPQYGREDGRDVVDINLFTESYGGKYGPAFATHIYEQNELQQSPFAKIEVNSLGIMQGCIDDLVQNPYYATFAYNNTYGIGAINEDEMKLFLYRYNKPNGCRDQITTCRERIKTRDPKNRGNIPSVNEVCTAALSFCDSQVIQFFEKKGRSRFDIAQSALNPLPPSTYLEYLNRAEVQSAIGVAPLNFTEISDVVATNFLLTGDYMRGEYISDLATLLSRGVRVALIYGDRDFICNWKGGEAASFSIAATASSPYLSGFNAAGYAPLNVNDTYSGGDVRQFGNLLFTRIYDAGHAIPFYQPETLYTLFTRIIKGLNPSTGHAIEGDPEYFKTSGARNSTKMNTPPQKARQTCYVRKAEDTCTQDQLGKLKRGEGKIINGVWYENEGDWIAPDERLKTEAGTPGQPGNWKDGS